jgi:hypothetical protein
MNRDELEKLERDALVRMAEEGGVEKARVLTRPELVDELLLRSTVDHATRQRSRGLFGRARDLIARVVEQGLHLPDAAERIRAMGLPPPSRPTAPAALPTVTLAQIYIAQGHRARAIDTLTKVLAREPDHAVAGALLGRLTEGDYPVPAPVLPPEDDAAALATAQSAESEDTSAPALDQCLAVLVDGATLRVSWSVRTPTFEHARKRTPGARVALCVHVVEPTWDGPKPSSRCYEVDATQGEFMARDLPSGCVVRAAVGCLDGAVFAPFAHSPASETSAPPV